MSDDKYEGVKGFSEPVTEGARGTNEERLDARLGSDILKRSEDYSVESFRETMMDATETSPIAEQLFEDHAVPSGVISQMQNNVFETPMPQLTGNLITDAINQLKEMVAIVPDIMEQTVAISMIPQMVPEEGFDIVEVVRGSIKDYNSIGLAPEEGMAQAIEKISSMSDQEIISGAQEILHEKGMHNLANKIGDGNISQEDAVRGIAEFGYVVNKRGEDVDYGKLDQIKEAMGDVGHSTVLTGLLFTEDFIDKEVTRVANEMGQTIENLDERLVEGHLAEIVEKAQQILGEAEKYEGVEGFESGARGTNTRMGGDIFKRPVDDIVGEPLKYEGVKGFGEPVTEGARGTNEERLGASLGSELKRYEGVEGSFRETLMEATQTSPILTRLFCDEAKHPENIEGCVQEGEKGPGTDQAVPVLEANLEMKVKVDPEVPVQ